MKRYLRDNSLIYFISSYKIIRLRPRCWFKSTRKCSSFQGKSVRLLKFYLNWVQIGESQIGFYLWIILYLISTKGILKNNFYLNYCLFSNIFYFNYFFINSSSFFYFNGATGFRKFSYSSRAHNGGPLRSISAF